jgi:Leucine Rich repeat
MPEKPSPKSCGHRLRVSVRTLMILVLILGGGLAWIVHRAHVQRDAVAAVQRARGRVWYDWQLENNGSYDPNGKAWSPSWLVDLLGIDYFDSVRRVFLLGCGSDGELVSIGNLARIEVLLLDNSSVTDAGLVYLGRLSTLGDLNLRGTQVTDAGLVHLGGIISLQYLGLEGTQVTDAGLANLRGLTNLQGLWLKGTQVTDAGLVHLAGITSLRVLNLEGTRVTDAGAERLRRLLPKATIIQ